MKDKKFKNRIKKYFNFLYKNLKTKTNIDLCINYTHELNSDIMKQYLLYGGGGGGDIAPILSKVTDIIESYKSNQTIDLPFKNNQSYYSDPDKKIFKTEFTIDEYNQILDPSNNILIPQSYLKDILLKLQLLSDYFKISLEYIFESVNNGNAGNLTDLNMKKEELEKLSLELDDFIKNIKSVVDLKDS